jgi:cytoplasmic iron level regulating protein YaaA (DUF328/UPF0246 family)
MMKQAQPTGLTMTTPLFLDQTKLLLAKLQLFNEEKVQEVLSVSAPLAKLNYIRFQNWESTEKRAALWMYGGDVYNGFDAYTLSRSEIRYAQNNVLIISGLYGLIRPLDAVQPYRLEMKLPFTAGVGSNLYDYWSGSLAKHIESSSVTNVLMCASLEYAKAIVPYLPKNVKLLTPRFMQETDSGLREKGLFAKYARGALARWIVDNNITDFKDLESYDGEGFVHSEKLSTTEQIVFIVPKGFSLKGRFVNK